ncbi:DUF29 domain-containing protein [Anabaena sphaerica FACHB-251]|uniref:DUF29 domain-containing protein n=1 Tax=Anabaena sphaerica FACHB-251 TaxID=2692883 RepID=A0A926ZZM4_9NOST|nr:DUF29 domain-containing protein [Anabaena sphaerica]MBD2292568.1 DUF29 domain-containing protein [Anabaena sphaerica FACHB-251]
MISNNQFGLNSLYEQNYQLWLESTIENLKHRNFDNLDIDLLVEEIEEMGGSLKDALENNLIVIIAHLLKCKYQPEKRSGSWRASIKEHRRRINKSIQKHPSLKNYYESIFAECYSPALDWAAEETGLLPDIFPEKCPFTTQQVLDSEFFP